jgi:hypothetical protein
VLPAEKQRLHVQNEDSRGFPRRTQAVMVEGRNLRELP